MPIVQYKCSKCYFMFDNLILNSADISPLDICPQCKSPANKIISSPNFILKGGGWTEKYSEKNKKENK